MFKLVLIALVACTAEAAGNGTRILIMGDSWGTVSPATEHFEKELKEHSCPLGGFTNIAIGGTTAKQWAERTKVAEVKKAAKTHDLIWITLMGNDARAIMPPCAKKGKSAPACGDELMVDVLGWMSTILDGIHEANPNAQVVGFGYDIMFGGLGCTDIAKSIIPQCWDAKNETNHIRCFNTQLIRIQDAWETLAAKYPFVTAINLLGTTQVAQGDKKAAIGKPDLDKFGPAKDWPITYECFHPGTAGGDHSGAMEIMKQFYDQYWSKALHC